MDKTFRPGAAGALLDEYGRAILDLQDLVAGIPVQDLAAIVDAGTADENCRSIQTILSHVISCGYNYAFSIGSLRGRTVERPGKKFLPDAQEYIRELANMFSAMEDALRDLKDYELEQFDNSLKIRTGWGQLYDIEQMAEHAIVHVLRHRRQIERYTMILGRR